MSSRPRLAGIGALIVLAALALSPPTVSAADVQLFSPAVFGASTSAPVKLLRERSADETEPYLVTVDVSCGVYVAASIFYREPATFKQVRASLDKLFHGHELKVSAEASSELAIWRIECGSSSISTGAADYCQRTGAKGIFSVQLTEEQGAINVIYVDVRRHADLGECSDKLACASRCNQAEDPTTCGDWSFLLRSL